MKREIILSPQGSRRCLATNSDHVQNCSQAPCLLLGYLLLTIASNLLLKTIRDLIGKEGAIALTSQSFLITSQVISAAAVLSFFRGGKTTSPGAHSQSPGPSYDRYLEDASQTQ